MDEEIFKLAGTDAKTAIGRVWQAFRQCTSFSYQFSNGPVVHFSMKPGTLTGVGQEAFDGVQTAPEVQGGATLVAVRVGDVIATVTVSSPGPDLGSAAIGYARQIARNITAA